MSSRGFLFLKTCQTIQPGDCNIAHVNMGELLDKIQFPEDLRKLEKHELVQVAQSLRERIIDVVSQAGGHLGASLGTVELTVALHFVYNTPFDKIIWDVGHQAYGHKILTGRSRDFHSLRKKGGLSGFPKIEESEYDTFGTGHSSTSISAVLGLAACAKNARIHRKHIALIGDASMQAGMSFEALNHLGDSAYDVLIVLNDNCMSIDPSVGALNTFLQKSAAKYHKNPDKIKEQLWSEPNKKPEETNIFEDLGIRYFGPVDGHDTVFLSEVFEKLKAISGPKILHTLTFKGKGYAPAEKGNPTKWHAPGLFDAKTGKVLKDSGNLEKPHKFQDVFGKTLVELVRSDSRIMGITPAMPTGSSLTYLMKEFPERAFDVGIAEQHAVTFSAGLARGGSLPYCVIYSTFLQRGYDQLIHDVAVQNLKVIFCIDRAGLVGEDGATHQGAYDLAFLRVIPNMTIAAPRNEQELVDMMFLAASDDLTGPAAIRYPRGRGFLNKYQTPPNSKMPIGRGIQISKGEKIAVLSLGTAAQNVIKARELLASRGIALPAHFDMRFLKPLDTELLDEVFEKFETLITVEDASTTGGLGSAVCEYAAEKGLGKKIVRLGIPDQVIEHATQAQQQAQCGFDAVSIADLIERENRK